MYREVLLIIGVVYIMKSLGKDCNIIISQTHL